jgi:hypothetical protein
VQPGHRDRAPPARPLDVHVGPERRHRDGHVGRVRRDARRRVPDDREVAVLALAGRAAGSGRALVARLGDVLEVRAARALEQVAADRGEVAQLPGGALEQRLREQRMAPADELAGREVAVADRRADPQAAFRRLLDPVVRQPGDVDQVGRPLDAEPHEVDEVGPAAEVHHAGALGRSDGAGGLRGALVRERLQGAACAIAATIPG